MTVVWEAARRESFYLSYGTNPDDFQICANVACQKETSGSGCLWLYRAQLENLQAHTHYNYRLQIGENILYEANFQTLPAQPETLHIVTISDSHLMHQAQAFAAMVHQENPAFILHSGDISFGTGYQHEQYVENWFQRLPQTLAHVPFFYIAGNHDDGPCFDDFFMHPQQQAFTQAITSVAPDGRSYALDYGILHVIMLDSNPWGLFEMNAENSGLALDTAMQNRLQATLAWLEEDLQSECAQAASWRLLVSHHPYTDAFQNRHIVPLAERYRVQLVLGGHLHYYVKAVSVSPNIGARMFYITQGSLQDPEAGLNKGEGAHRLLEEFPEVIAMGQSNYGVLDVSATELRYRVLGFDMEGKSHCVDEIHLRHEEPNIKLSHIRLRRLDNNGHVEILATAHNVGNIAAEVILPLFDNEQQHLLNLFGAKKESRVAVLAPGESRALSTIYEAKTQGKHNLVLGDVTAEIIVFEPTELSYAHMHLELGKGEMANCLLAGIEATNNLDHEVFTSVPLYIDQRIAQTQREFFRAHEKRWLSFCHTFAQGGAYQASVADQLPQEVHIEGGIRIVPRILDKSGHGRLALLQGSPKVREADGQMEVVLENYGDYIEIPNGQGIATPEGLTGMVWAKMNRLARADEMGHSPLMVRGASVGWGATYCLRMVVDRTGSLKWGICHDVTEYQWQGGMAKVGDWAHYTMAFSKAKGGDAYVDGMRVAHVPGIDKKAKLRQWESEPLFIGYSYIGHVIPQIGRPKYFTHLPASIRMARFYTQGLTEKEIQAIQHAPEALGAKEEALALWLDFRQILTVGTHVTEWRRPAVHAPLFQTQKSLWHWQRLRIKASIPKHARAKTTLELSDDRTSIKGQMGIDVQDSTQYYTLSDLPPAQYLRLRTELAAEVGADGVFVPELMEYQITATDGESFVEIYWSTRPDWERGTFSGAVDFKPVDRLRAYPEYTDIIHG